jgi:predicted GNAT family acetyltransferase
VRFVLTNDPVEFQRRTERLLGERIECNVLATVLITVLAAARPKASSVRPRNPGPDDTRGAPTFAYGVDDEGQVRFAALRTPPWPLLTGALETGDARELVDLWLRADPDVPSVNGPPQATRAIASAWAALTGGTFHYSMREAMHVLDDVRDPPRPARGELRAPEPGERKLLADWMRAFAQEAGLPGADRAEAIVDGRLRQDGLLVWHDAGPVSMVGVSPPVAGVVRIGPVYTPPEHRRRGYAGSAVAAASRRALVREAERCMLFTDLANPTSNKIYAEVGYRRVGDWEELAFERPARGADRASLT